MSRHGKRRRTSPEESYDAESYDPEAYTHTAYEHMLRHQQDEHGDPAADPPAGAAASGDGSDADASDPGAADPDAPHDARAERPAPEPLEADDIKIVALGTVVWFVLFLASLPFRGTLEENDREWWPWCALAGAGLGLLGLWYLRRRRDAMRRRANG